MCLGLFPIFSSIIFSVSGFMQRSLIHLDLSFVQGDKNKSNCILLNTDHQLNHLHILKTFFFSPLADFISFIKVQMGICVCLHFWGFNSVPLIYHPDSLPIPNRFHLECSVKQCKVRDLDSYNFF